MAENGRQSGEPTKYALFKEGEKAINLNEILVFFSHYKWVIIGMTFTVLLLSGINEVFLKDKIYASETQVRINNLTLTSGTRADDSVQVLLSSSVPDLVIEPERISYIVEQAQIHRMIADNIRRESGIDFTEKQLEDMVSASNQPGSSTVLIRAVHSDPEISQLVTVRTLDSIHDYLKSLQFSHVARQLAFLDTELDKAQRAYDTAYQDLKQLTQGDRTLEAIEAEFEANMEILKTIREELIEAKISFSYLEQVYLRSSDQLEKTSESIVLRKSHPSDQDRLLESLLLELPDADLELLERIIASVETEEEILNPSFSEISVKTFEVFQEMVSMEAKVDALESAQEDMEHELKSLQADLSEMKRTYENSLRKERGAYNTLSIYEELITLLHLKESSIRNGELITVVEAAEMPTKDEESTLFNLALNGILALFGSILLVFLHEIWKSYRNYRKAFYPDGT